MRIQNADGFRFVTDERSLVLDSTRDDDFMYVDFSDDWQLTFYDLDGDGYTDTDLVFEH